MHCRREDIYYLIFPCVRKTCARLVSGLKKVNQPECFLSARVHLKTLDVRNEYGFTLIEIIAVLVILGILAVISIPKYLSIVDATRNQSAQAAISEIKGRLSAAQAKYMMYNSGAALNSPALYTYATSSNAYGDATNLANMGGDFTVSVTSGTPITISVTAVSGQTVNVAGNFSAGRRSIDQWRRDQLLLPMMS